MPTGDRGALLASIQKGTKLKKAATNDRSAPQVGNGTNGKGAVSSEGERPRMGAAVTTGGNGASGGPQLGGLFAGGMPKLRSTGRLPNAGGSGERKETTTTTTMARPSAPKPASNPTRPPPVKRDVEAPKRTEAPIQRKPPVMGSPRKVATPSGVRTTSPDRSQSSPTIIKPALPSRPPLPSRPTRPSPIETGMRTMPVAERAERWNFPPEQRIPKPERHSGRGFVYPSGREAASYINEPVDGPVIHPRRNVEDATRRMKNININTAGMGIKAIQEKLDGLERQLAMAIERQDFECCVDLKPRISVLKGMLERGQPVDPSELDAI